MAEDTYNVQFGQGQIIVYMSFDFNKGRNKGHAVTLHSGTHSGQLHFVLHGFEHSGRRSSQYGTRAKGIGDCYGILIRLCKHANICRQGCDEGQNIAVSGDRHPGLSEVGTNGLIQFILVYEQGVALG